MKDKVYISVIKQLKQLIMSLYNMINGVKPSTFFVLPMLGKHPDEYPRFRDCFTSDENYPEYDDHIHIYTRVGGGNRDCGMGEEQLQEHPNYVTDFDDDFDSTYATYVFSIPVEFRQDYELIKEGKFKETSNAYKDLVRGIYPKLKKKLDEIFN